MSMRVKVGFRVKAGVKDTESILHLTWHGTEWIKLKLTSVMRLTWLPSLFR